MRYETTPAVERALEAALRWATAEAAEQVSPRHLLLGLLDEEEGRAAALLIEAGLDLPAWRISAGPPPIVEPPSSLRLTSLSRTVLGQALHLAANVLGEGSVSSECLLLAVVQNHPEAAESLVAHGLDLSRLDQIALGLAAPPLRLDEPLELGDPGERIDTARILDAALNRAREALRVLEDHARFVLNDALLCRELKEMRHGLVAALEAVPPGRLLESRNTLGDVGTAVGTTSEYSRLNLAEVVQANCKRLQEALRSLEEFGKVFGPEVGRALEQLRYRSYTLERVLLAGGTGRDRLAECRLMVLLTGSQCAGSLEWTLREAAAGGADVIQLREKTLSDRELLERAVQVRRWTREAGVLFILNDRPDIARLAEADGVHLGQTDLPVLAARKILGSEALIGVSTHDLEQLRRAVLDGASYVGVGPVFPSQTKTFEALAGLEYVRQATAETSRPAFVLGGINAQTLPEAVAAGARRIAVSHAVARASDPRAAAQALRRTLSG